MSHSINIAMILRVFSFSTGVK